MANDLIVQKYAVNPLNSSDDLELHKDALDRASICNNFWVRKNGRVFCCGEIIKYAVGLINGEDFMEAFFRLKMTKSQDTNLRDIYTNPGRIDVAFVDNGERNCTFLLERVSLVGANILTTNPDYIESQLIVRRNLGETKYRQIDYTPKIADIKTIEGNPVDGYLS